MMLTLARQQPPAAVQATAARRWRLAAADHLQGESVQKNNHIIRMQGAKGEKKKDQSDCDNQLQI